MRNRIYGTAIFLIIALIVARLIYLEISNSSPEQSPKQVDLDEQQVGLQNSAGGSTTDQTGASNPKRLGISPVKPTVTSKKLFETKEEFMKVYRQALVSRQKRDIYNKLKDLGIYLDWQDFEAVYSQAEQENRRVHFYHVYNQLIRTYPAAMALWASRLPMEAGQNYILTNIINVWLTINAVDTEAFIIEHGFREQFEDLLLGMKDPEKALNGLISDSGGARNNWKTFSILRRWSGNHPTQALEWIDKNLEGPNRERALLQILPALSKIDKTKALELINAMSRNHKLPAISIYAAELAKEKPREAAELLASHLAERGWANFRPVIKEWAKRDINEAAAFIKSLEIKNNSVKNAMLYPLAEEWAKTNPWEAYQWSEELKEQERNLFHNHLAREAAKRDPALALNIANDIYNSYNNPHIYQGVISIWAEKEPKKVAEWLASFDNEELKPALQDSLVNSWIYYNPAELYDYATQNGLELSENQKASLARNWLKIDEDAVINWYNSQEPGDEKAATAEEIAKHIAGSDPDKAMAFIQKNVEPGKRDDVTLKAASSMQYQNPDKAIEFISGIKPTEENKRTYWYTHVNIARNLANRDPDKAVSWASNLSYELEGYGNLAKKTTEAVVFQLAWRNPEKADQILQDATVLNGDDKKRIEERLKRIRRFRDYRNR